MRETTPTLPRVLVVDDNAANRELALQILESEGYEVRVAASGQECLSELAREPADCVLLDVRMPGLDGFAVCERIRALPGGAEIPVIFLTAMRDVETFDRAALAGGDDFLTKPVRPTELLLRVQATLRLRQLGGERRELFEQVRRQRDAMTRLQLQKEQMTTFLVNDLKGPVGSIALHAQSILYTPEVSEEVRDGARRIQSDARQLLRLILNLLDISKGEEGQLLANRAEIELAQLIRDVVAGMTIQAETVGVRLRTSGEAPTIAVDPGLIRRAVASLVDNAIRYAPVGSEVEIRVEPGPSGVVIRIIDAGPGVAPERRAEIFDRFAQLSTDEAGIGRTGLGLAFCKLAVEAHGGRIWVEDASPGAVFCVELPHGPRG
jgi:two-component system, sensor histidine kinase and response regulator